ncbi:MAG: integrase core domain-containing protein [Phycisphaerae bacterium]
MLRRAELLTERWRQRYDHARLHSSLGWRPAAPPVLADRRVPKTPGLCPHAPGVCGLAGRGRSAPSASPARNGEWSCVAI